MRSPAARVRQLRCAIYTRKSSEEGLEQDFNSLHAQREASESYIKSQKHEGWNALPAAYDDGGYSGGTMERPGLRKLLADIQSGMIDVVVVYKVDRLTRSLTDFARIVELFDQHGVSYDADQGEPVEVKLVGVYELPKQAGAVTQGEPVYWRPGPIPPQCACG